MAICSTLENAEPRLCCFPVILILDLLLNGRYEAPGARHPVRRCHDNGKAFQNLQLCESNIEPIFPIGERPRRSEHPCEFHES